MPGWSEWAPPRARASAAAPLALTCPLAPAPPRSLYNNEIGGSCEALGEALEANSSLKKLDMVGCELEPEDGKGLAGGLAIHASLTSLR